MSLGEAIDTLKILGDKTEFTDYPDLEQIKIIRKILEIIKMLEVPELIGWGEEA